MSQPGTSFGGLVSLVLLGSPLVLAPFTLESNRRFIEEVENREPSPLPKVEGVADLLEPEAWAGLSTWLQERVPFRGEVISAKSWVDMELLGNRRIGGVDRGDGGWLFLRQSYGEHWTRPGAQAGDAVRALDDFLDRQSGSESRFRILLTPDKHTIYPEHLTSDGKRDVEKTRAGRNLLEGWFAQSDDARIIDLHGAMRARKAVDDQELYFRDDTHQNWHGGTVMAEAIVDSLQPAIWDADHVFTAQTIAYPGDLRRLLSVSSFPDREKQVLAVARPGVVPREIDFEGDVYRDFAEIDSNPHAWQYPVRVRYDSTEGLPLISGRTLILHDSCIGSIARPLLRPYFADVQFIHYTDASPEFLDRALQEYDQVIIEVVERIAPETLVELLAPPDPEAPSLQWNRTDGTTVYRLNDLASVEPRLDTTMSRATNGFGLTATNPVTGFQVHDLDIAADTNHVVRVIFRTPQSGQAALHWIGGNHAAYHPDRRTTINVRGGRNEIHFPLRSDQRIETILFEPGGGVGDYLIESLEIRRIPPTSSPPPP